MLVPSTLSALRNSHPGLETKTVEAYNDELLNMLRTNQVEFAIAADLGNMSDMAFEPLVDDAFCVVFPPEHPIGERSSITWRDLTAYPLVLLSPGRSEEHTSELQSLMRISYAVFCLKKNNTNHVRHLTTTASTTRTKPYEM